MSYLSIASTFGDRAIRSAKPKAKQSKLHDGGGVLLIVKPSGGRLWRLKYRHSGKEQQLSLGRADVAKSKLNLSVEPQ